MTGVLEDVKNEFEHLHLDLIAMNRSLGIDLVNRRYIDLNDKTHEELYDLTVRSLMWLETINEKLTNSIREEGRAELNAEAVLANVIKASSGAKVTEARLIAKGHPEYIKAMNQKILLSAYVSYLKQATENLNKYHYTVKAKNNSERNIERKY